MDYITPLIPLTKPGLVHPPKRFVGSSPPSSSVSIGIKAWWHDLNSGAAELPPRLGDSLTLRDELNSAAEWSTSTRGLGGIEATYVSWSTSKNSMVYHIFPIIFFWQTSFFKKGIEFIIPKIQSFCLNTSMIISWPHAPNVSRFSLQDGTWQLWQRWQLWRRDILAVRRWRRKMTHHMANLGYSASKIGAV